MKIHQITHLFQPDSLGGAALYTDLARFLRDRGHDVRVTTTFSYYPKLHYSEADKKAGVRDELFEGIPLRRIPMVLPRRHQGWRRLIPEASYAWRLWRHGRFADWIPDIVLTACPMLAQPLAAQQLYRRRGVPMVLIVQDLMADAALHLGIVKHPILGKALLSAERPALAGATHVVAIAEGLKDRLQEQALTRGNVMVIPNWIHGSLQREATRNGSTPLQNSPYSLFYSGNLGVKQGFPDFLSDFFSVCGPWVLRVHGDGPEAESLRAVQESHTGFSLGPLLPEQEYLQYLRAAPACLITQRRGSGSSFLPSKLLPALASGKPVLAVCERGSPLGREIEAHGFGVIVEPGDRAGLAAVLRRWQSHPEEPLALGRLALARAIFFHRERILPQYEQLLSDVAARAHERS